MWQIVQRNKTSKSQKILSTVTPQNNTALWNWDQNVEETAKPDHTAIHQDKTR